MMNLFQITPNDQALYYLGQIFGLVGTLLPTNAPNPLVGIMFKVFNTSVLTLGSGVVVYTTVVGLLKTAQEGEFLGKQWNSLWVPVRTVMGIASLFPTSTGYSAIQVVMMWIVVQGIGAADTVWTAVVDYTIKVGGNPYTTVNPSQVPNTLIASNIKTLYQNLVCQASARGPSNTTAQNVTSGGGTTQINYYCADGANDPFCQRPVDDMLNINGQQGDGKTKYSMGPNAAGGGGGACGTLTYCDSSPTGPNCQNPNAQACIACKAQQQILQTIVPLFGQIAQGLVDADYAYIQFYEQPHIHDTPKVIAPTPPWVTSFCNAQSPAIPTEQCCMVKDPLSPLPCSGIFKNYSDIESNDTTNLSTSTIQNLYFPYQLKPTLSSGSANFVNVAVDQYMASVLGAVNANIMNQINNTPQNEGKDWQQDAKQKGWILAGAYYYYMSNADKTTIDATMPNLQVDAADVISRSNPMNGYRNNFSASDKLLTGITQQMGSQPTFGAPPQFAGVTASLGAAQSSLLHTFMSNLSGEYNPAASSNTNPGAPQTDNALRNIAKFGYLLMIIAQITFFAILYLAGALATVLSINFMGLGTGMTLNPFGEGIKAMVNIVSPFIFMLITGLYSLGAMLGIYVPLIPLVVFTVGAIGWFLGVIEAMMAAPIVAIGILSPGGQHDILGRAEQGLMTIFNTFLRPTLMIFGLMIAMLLSNVVVNLINAGFLAATHQIMKAPGLFESILFIAAYVSLVVTALNKTFSLIYLLPERVLTWIGGHAVQYGEGEALSATQRAVEGASGQIGGAAKEGAGAAIQAAPARAGAMKKQKDQEEGKLGPDLTTTKGGGDDSDAVG